MRSIELGRICTLTLLALGLFLVSISVSRGRLGDGGLELSRWALIHADLAPYTTVIYKNQTYGPNSFPGLTCEDILFVTPPHSLDDILLDDFREAWASKQEGTCFFKVQVDTPSTRVPDHVAKLWQMRTSKPPVALVQRYRSGLYLMTLVRLGLIRTFSGEEPWIMYADSDTMMANSEMSISKIVSRAMAASSDPTLEQNLCEASAFACDEAGDPAKKMLPAPPTLLISLSEIMSYGYYTESGVIFFQATLLNGFLFQVLADSPYEVIDTKEYKMGDQAIWDLMVELLFQVDWGRFYALSADETEYGKVMREPCEDNVLLFRREFNPPGVKEHPLIQKAFDFWTAAGSLSLQGNLAYACSRWFNAAGCPMRRRDDHPFSFRCGDFLWHLYGCAKDVWRYETSLRELLESPSCASLLPTKLPELPPPTTEEALNENSSSVQQTTPTGSAVNSNETKTTN